MIDNRAAGKVVELIVMTKLLERGFECFVPLVDTAIDVVCRSPGGTWYKIQVKKVVPQIHKRQVQLKFKVGNGLDGKRPYQAKDVDFFIAHDGNQCYIVPYLEAMTRKDNGEVRRGCCCVNSSHLERWDLLN